LQQVTMPPIVTCFFYCKAFDDKPPSSSAFVLGWNVLRHMKSQPKSSILKLDHLAAP